MGRKFLRHDDNSDGLIDRQQFGNIIKELDLKLSPLLLQQYISTNFSFVDRELAGKISFGQFLACYANFLYSYEISQVRCQRALYVGSVHNSRIVMFGLCIRQPAWSCTVIVHLQPALASTLHARHAHYECVWDAHQMAASDLLSGCPAGQCRYTSC